jgi:hypothetical protein
MNGMCQKDVVIGYFQLDIEQIRKGENSRVSASFGLLRVS